MNNQRGDEVFEDELFQCWSDSVSVAEMQQAIGLLCEHLGVVIVRTTATEHGNTELVLREVKEVGLTND